MDIRYFANQAMFELKKKSPTIMLAAGIGTGIYAAYLACKATLKVDPILDEANKKIADIHRIAEDQAFRQDHPELAAQFTEENKARALAVVYGQTILGLAKLYGPSILVEGTSIALLLGSHHSLTKQVAGLGATVTILSKSLERYRGRVAEIYGEEKENEIYYGITTEKVEEIVIDEETGKESKKKINAKVVKEELTVSPYARFFDSSNPNYIKDDPVHNVDFLANVQTRLREDTKRRGWLFLNTALMAYGFKPVPEGQILGWTYDRKDPYADDKIIDIGIDHISRQEVRDFRNGYEKVFLLDFDNVQPIIETFTDFDKTNTI